MTLPDMQMKERTMKERRAIKQGSGAEEGGARGAAPLAVT